MCGRYGLEVSGKELVTRYRLADGDDPFKEKSFERKEEIYPTTLNLILLPDRKLHAVKWGFIPSFAKRPLINARSESVLEKKTFREPFKYNRCLVPASCFYEWQPIEGQKKKDKKQIRVKGLSIFSMAGICESYSDTNGQTELTFAILTTGANGQMQPIHDRMPVILQPEDENIYLDPEADIRLVQSIIKPTELTLDIK